MQPKNTDPFAITLLLYYLGALKTLEEISLFFVGWMHSSPESGPNPKVNNHPESIWNMVWLFMPVEKNLFRKFFIGGPSRKFKNLAKKLSDFGKNLTTQKTICVDLLVKISSKSDNFLAKFLL